MFANPSGAVIFFQPMFKIYFKIIVLLLISSAGFAQELSESHIAKIREVQSLLVTNPEKAYEAAKQMSASDNGTYHLFGIYYIANYHYNKSDYAKAKQLLIELLNDIHKSGKAKSDKRYVDLKVMCVNKLFYIHKNQGEYDLALLYLDKYKEGIPTGRFDEQFGIAKVALGDYAKGIAMLKNAAATSPHLKLGEGENQAMNNKLFADKYNAIGESYQKYYMESRNKVFLDSADYYFDKAANLLIQENFEVDYTTALLNLRKGHSAAFRKQYQKALALYRKGRSYKIIDKNIRTIQLFDLGMAYCFYHLKQYDSAISYSHRYIKNYEITKISKENLLTAYNILSQSYDAKDNSKKAYLYAQKSLTLIASIDKIKHESLAFVNNYDLKKIKSESTEMLNEKKYFKLALFAIVFILMATVLSFYYYSRLQKKKHQRFLQIIKRIREKPETNIVNNQPVSKQTMDDDFIAKTAQGLKKLEEKETYLKPTFKLAFVAQKLNTNTAYLSQYFNQVMHKSFSEYTQELRINYVLQKLHDNSHFSNYTLQAIAEEVGYKDATTFVRVFKKQTGLSPNYYIEELKK